MNNNEKPERLIKVAVSFDALNLVSGHKECGCRATIELSSTTKLPTLKHVARDAIKKEMADRPGSEREFYSNPRIIKFLGSRVPA